jgi:hypothetical protein
MLFTLKDLKEFIDSKDQYDLFKFYCPNVSFSTNCSSPLRSGDILPSFRLFYSNGATLFNDFGLGEVGDIYKFVGLLYGLNYNQSKIKIYKDIQGISNISNRQVVSESRKSKTEILYVLKDPSLEDKLYWKDYINDLKTLNKFKIYPISQYLIGSYSFTCKKPTFIFKIGSRIKIYQPGQTIKYLGNTNSSSIQGWEMLKFHDRRLILVSSMKEVLVLHELGIQAIAPNSESTIIPPHIMNFLKFYFNIEILYDWDNAGRKNALKHSVLYNLPINKLQFNNYKMKDLSDFKKQYGFNSLKNVILQ